MNELSGRETVPNNSRSNPACGGIGCVPVVFGSTVGVGVKRSTRPRMESAAIDLVISPLACATTLSTYARATAGVLQMSNSRCLSRTARDSFNRARIQSFRAIRSTAYCAPTRS